MRSIERSRGLDCEFSGGALRRGYAIATDTVGVDSKAGWTYAGLDAISTPGDMTSSRRRLTSTAPFLFLLSDMCVEKASSG
jgi:hypothetical protein